MISIITILLIAISLSMDTFSLSIAYGTIGIEKKMIFLLSTFVGIFHFFMPMLGNAIGVHLLIKLPINPLFIVGSILILLVFQIIFSHNEIVELKNILSIFLFAFTVSFDSFSVGVTISEITRYHYFSYFSFAIVSFVFTFVGLKFGKIINMKYEQSAKYIGICILFVLGMYYIITSFFK